MLHEGYAEAVADRFGLGAHARLVGPVARGRLGAIWRLDTATGRYAVKEADTPVPAADALRDAAYQDAVRAGGVPMPAVVRTVDGEVLATVGDALVRVYEWVDVAGTDRRLDPVAVGRVVAAIHRVVVPAGPPVDPWYVDPVGPEGWADLVARLSAARAPFADRLAALVPDVLAVEALVRPPSGPLQVCHHDLWADNLRARGNGVGRRAAAASAPLVVLDWENSGADDPSRELACVVFEFGCGQPARMRALASAYAEAGGPGRLTEPSDLSTLVAQLGHIVQEGCRRWLRATTPAQRRDNEEWVAEFLDDPVTLRTVEQMLAAVR